MKFLFLSFLVFSTELYAVSAKRLPGENESIAAFRNAPFEYLLNWQKKNLASSENLSVSEPRSSITAYYARKEIDSIDFDQVSSMNSYEELEEAFLRIRDRKFLNDPIKSQERKRRLSWMFPDDGCWVRAEFMRRMMAKSHNVKTLKMFIFGRLKVETDYHPRGRVTWWYHVAPILKVGELIYILDPSLDHKKPLLLNDWVLKQTNAIENVTFALCSEYTFNPMKKCYEQKETELETSETLISTFLYQEKERLRTMGLPHELYLGDEPPWMGSEDN